MLKVAIEDHFYSMDYFFWSCLQVLYALIIEFYLSIWVIHIIHMLLNTYEIIKMSLNVKNQRFNYPTHQYIKIRNTIVLFTFLLQYISIILTFITNW